MSDHDPQLGRLKLPTIVKGAGILFTCGLTGRVLGYAFHILAAKKIGLTALGLYTLGLTVLRTIAIGLPGGSSSPVVRYVSMYHARGDDARVKGTILFAIKNTALLGVVSAGAFFLLSDYVAVTIFHQPQLATVLAYLAFSIPFVRLSAVLLRSIVGVQIITFQAWTKDLLEPFAMLAVLLLLVSQGFKLQALVYAYLSAAILGFVAAFYFFMRTFGHLFSHPFSSQPAAQTVTPVSESKAISKFALPLVVAHVFTKLRRWGDILLLGFFMAPSMVGLYTIIFRTVNTLSEISDALIGVFNPMISASFEKGALATLTSQLQILSRWIFSLSFPLILFGLFHARLILSVLGDRFIGGEHAFVILLLGFSFQMTTAPTGQMLTMTGRSPITLINTVGIGILNLILFLALIPRYGIEGTSVAVALSMVLLGIARVIEGHTLIGIHPFTRSYLKPLIASCGSLLFTLLIDRVLPENRYLFVGCSFAIFSSIYLAALLLMGLDPADRFILAKVKERILPGMEAA